VPIRIAVILTACAVMLSTASGQAPLTTAQIAKRVSSSVVLIQGKTASGDVLGSGFIVSKDGKIVTNLHVIREMESASVQLATGEIFDSVTVLATDERKDLAVVQIAGFCLPALAMGDSNDISVGERVVVVGCPRGLAGTVTAGILSSVRDSGGGLKVLQTDAALNPGNSGGPLVNSKGQAIGVIAFKLESSEGLNFAIPINYVRGILYALHGPITLDQMRKALPPTTALPLDSGTSGMSLKETLGWLERAISISSIHYVEVTKDVTIALAPVHFDSCTVSFDLTEVWLWDKDHSRRMVTRSTIPLDALDHGNIKQDPVYLSDSESLDIWVVFLRTKSDVIVEEFREDPVNPTRNNGSNAVLPFTRQPIARRVLEAFDHAADLCRKDKP